MGVIDSSVLIPLLKIGKLELLKNYFGKIKITQDVLEEVKGGIIGFSELDKASKDWIIIDKTEFKEIEEIARQEKIEIADASIILLALKDNDLLVSNDYALINVAKSKNIKYWWLTAFVQKCIEKKIINKKEAKEIIIKLVESGMYLDNIVFATIFKKIEENQ